LTERMPILFAPRWINTLCQPIAIENVLDYLLLSLAEPRSVGSIFEIGGPDVLTYAQIMHAYARSRGLNRILVRLPFLTPGLLAFGADVITPLPAPYLRILIEGLRSEVVVHDPRARHVFDLNLIPYDQALHQALDNTHDGVVSAYFKGGQPGLAPGNTSRIIEGTFIEQRRLVSPAGPRQVYSVFAALGGPQGWYYAEGLWQLRGLIDRLLGGVGMRKPPKDHPRGLQPGAERGGYRVDLAEEGHLLRLRSEMKAPGPTWMQFEVQPRPEGGSLYIQTAFFEPHGLLGLAYWYGLYPFHQLIFNGLARAILRRAQSPAPPPP
ncbi:MAG: SDR family oxidoreductase, partial [Acidobacteriaceae bacterium]